LQILSEVEAFYFVRYVNSEVEVFNAVITLAILLGGGGGGDVLTDGGVFYFFRGGGGGGGGALKYKIG